MKTLKGLDASYARGSRASRDGATSISRAPDDRVAERHQARAVEWMEASGASRVWTRPVSSELTAGQHQAGTCRMGCDPTTWVTAAHGRVHGHDNLWVMDGSVHVTNGGVNPVLNIYALAFRNAEELARC